MLQQRKCEMQNSKTACACLPCKMIDPASHVHSNHSAKDGCRQRQARCHYQRKRLLLAFQPQLCNSRLQALVNDRRKRQRTTSTQQLGDLQGAAAGCTAAVAC